MAPPMYLGNPRLLLLSVLLLLFVSVCFSARCSDSQPQSKQLFGRRRMLELEDGEEEILPLKKKTTTQSTKNQTKLIKPNLSLKNQTKLTKTIKSDSLSTKNQTKLVKLSSNSSKTTPTILADTGIKKLNSTSKIKKLNSTSKALNSTKAIPISSKKSSLDTLKTSNAKNKTTKPTATNENKIKPKSDQKLGELESEKPNKNQKSDKNAIQQKPKKQTIPSWIEQDDDDDFVSELRDLPSKFQQTLIPDLEKISVTSQAYITKANKQITKGFKPYVGNKYAPTIAAILCFAFILIPLLLVSLLFNKIKAYFSLQKLLIFIQVYLSIYFSILCLSSLVTGLEPLRFFYATSQSTYVSLQVLQTLGYVLYLLLLLMYLILVFSTECGMGSKILGLTQAFVGFAVGLHYYVTVFHRVVMRQPPKTTWKIHGIYATCFLMICLLARADGRKKTYLEEGGEEGKEN
ncbi:hypothetical protein L6164_012379 [Bauhinia variegata]|uniref:Uncharacterized protein n=1 Tax=Bauhinia variegata TaxID=167791 RepID=A0ACB9P8X3_BAUVA|nr:hypothetical protein L6164_012379 [Bauhinia variegata]